MKTRLAIVISHPIQHFAPLYAEIAKSDKVDLKVFFIAENGLHTYHDSEFNHLVKWDVALTDGYVHQFLEPGKILDRFSFFAVDSVKLLPALRDFQPDFIWLHGYAQRANWRVVVDKPNNANLIYSSDSNLTDTRSGLRKSIKSVVVRWFLRHCQYFLSISPTNREYLLFYGVDENKITDSSFPVDIRRWRLQRDQLTASDLISLRASLSIPEGKPIVLYAGKLIAHKRPKDLILALARPKLADAYGVFVGSGGQLEELRKLATELGVEARVRFIGFVNQSEMAQYFALADLFVFPSEKEPYGAIAAEILPFGLPMVVANGIGAVGASVFENRNALLYSAGDITALTDHVARLLNDAELHSLFSEHSIELAETQDKSLMARDIINICHPQQ